MEDSNLQLSLYIFSFIGAIIVILMIIRSLADAIKEIVEGRDSLYLYNYQQLLVKIKKYLCKNDRESLEDLCKFLVDIKELKVDDEGNFFIEDKEQELK